jgi:hypothetical protein
MKKKKNNDKIVVAASIYFTSRDVDWSLDF